MSRTVALACGAVVLVPGIAHVLAPVLRRRSGQAIVRRLARLSDLQPGVPVQLAITGSRRDGWMVYPEETLGHVWVVRRTDQATAPQQSRVDAFTATCPHMGCSIQLDATREGFLCPCHRAAFDLRGQALTRQQLGRVNPAPRQMDSLVCKIVPGENSDDWWVEVAYQAFRQGLADKVPLA